MAKLEGLHSRSGRSSHVPAGLTCAVLDGRLPRREVAFGKVDQRALRHPRAKQPGRIHDVLLAEAWRCGTGWYTPTRILREHLGYGHAEEGTRPTVDRRGVDRRSRPGRRRTLRTSGTPGSDGGGPWRVGRLDLDDEYLNPATRGGEVAEVRGATARVLGRKHDHHSRRGRRGRGRQAQVTRDA